MSREIASDGKHIEISSNAKAGAGWDIGVLVALLLLSVTMSVAVANWADGVAFTPQAAIAGLLFAALVTRLRLPGWLAHPLMLIEGAFVTALLMSSLVQPADATWNEKVLIMEYRFGRWITSVTTGGIGTDALLFAMLLCALAWLVGYVAGWSVFGRRQPWGAILPAGAALLLNQFYAPPQSGVILMAFLLAAMLLLVRTTLFRHQESWRRESIRYANDIGFDFITYGIVFSGIVILASWLVPPSAPGPQWFAPVGDAVRGPWQDLSEGVGRAFSTVRQVNNGGPTTMFGSSLSMAGPIRLGDRPVLNIAASQGRYWRAVEFDKYTGSGWVSTSSQSQGFSGWDPKMRVPPAILTREVTQTVQVLLPGDNLVLAATEPIQVSDPVDARFNVFQASPDTSYQDFSQLRLQKRMREGDTYTVISRVSAADEDALRQAPTNYPQAIRSRYLQLPADLPRRVRDLAVQLTSDSDNNYDKAQAIEQYLRARIKYDESVSAPPSDRDAVDYTLFDRPAGYCNYYASVMAVMARSIGIPARLASGYSNGDSDNGVYHINEGQAHTWPELYFGNLGWISFEPTSSKPPIERPVVEKVATPVPTEDPLFIPTRDPRGNPRDPNDRDTPPPGTSSFRIPWPTGLAGIAASLATGGILLAIALLGVVQVSWSRRMRMLPPASRAWEEMFRLARLVGYDDRAFATPYERSEQLSRALPDAGSDISDITSLYVRERYGAHLLTEEEAGRMGGTTRTWNRRIIRGALRRAWQLGPMRLAEQVRNLREKLQSTPTSEKN